MALTQQPDGSLTDEKGKFKGYADGMTPPAEDEKGDEKPDAKTETKADVPAAPELPKSTATRTAR